jgi:MFS family permease
MVYHVKRPIRPLFLWPIVGSLIGTGAFMLWGHHHFSTWRWITKESYPLYALLVALAGYVIAWFLFYALRFLFEKLRLLSVKLKHSRQP